MKVKIVLVEPEYQVNVGSVARILGNFGFSELAIVKPKCEIGLDAIKFSKHALDILKNASICKSFDEAVEGCQLVVGTSGIKVRNKDTIRACVGLEEFTKDNLKQIGNEKIAIVFGREGIGLTAKEIDRCDYLINIESDEKYPILNLSHAVAVIAYAIRKEMSTNEENPKIMKKEEMAKINFYMNKINDQIKHKRSEGVKLAIKRILYKGSITSLEAGFFISFLKEIEKKLDKR
jgi:TrmH family RNA methyltransferase